MNSAQYAPESSDSHTDTEFKETHNLILRLYASLLNNPLIQNSIKQLTRFSQPLIGRLDNGLVAIKSNVSKWVSRDCIFAQLANEWLSENYPYTGTLVSYEKFVKKMQQTVPKNQREDSEIYFRNFYDIATDIWKSFSDPALDDIRNSMLAIVAKLINQIHGLEEESLATALYNMLRMLIEKRRELLSAESFAHLVKISLDSEYYESHQQIIKTACDEYYSFAKRFLLVDFPLATSQNRNLLRVAFGFLQDNFFVGSDFTLNFIERHLDTLLHFCGQKPQENLEDNNLLEKTQRILSKALTLSVFPFKKIEHRLHYIKDTQLFTNLDKRLHISDRIGDAIGLTAWGYRGLKEHVVEPTLNAIRVTTDKTKSQAIVIMHGLDPRVLKKKYVKLRNQFHILKRCVVILEENTVKIIFDKKAREELGKEVKNEILSFYHEVKSLEKARIVNISAEYYAQILKKAKKTYTRAKKIEYYQDSENRTHNKVNKSENSKEETTANGSEASIESEQRVPAVEATA